MAYASFTDLHAATAQAGTLSQAVIDREVEETERTVAELRAEMLDALEVMRAAAATGSSAPQRSRSGLTGGDAHRLATSTAGPLGGTFRNALAGALATGEVNAAMGRIVAAPTGGASGVVPGVLLALAAEVSATDDDLVDALFVAGGIGGVIAARATLAGALGGCQAEIGSAAAMAAAAAVALCAGTPEQSGHAASLALQGLLGLVCDPVGGLVEIPCVVRNATGAAVALAAAEMALSGVEFAIPFDQVVDAAAHVGRSLPPSLRETALGGLAATPTAHELTRSAESRP